jgi:hypothetical protein
MMESHEKLSRLQRFIMIALLETRFMAMPRREFSQFVYKTWFKRESPAVRSSLSRAYQRLEAREFLIRKQGCWRLTEEMGSAGYVEAFNLWCDYRQGVLRDFGLKGPQEMLERVSPGGADTLKR